MDKYEHFEQLYSDEEIELAARVAHSVAQSMSEAFNMKKLPAWEQCHPWYRIRFTRSVEQYIYNGISCRNAHTSWVRRMEARGWTLGEYDAENKHRPDLVDFNDLPIELRLKAKQIRAAVMPFRKHEVKEKE